ncbi:nose resistant to fluoxetine protein 6-like isoform X2 [Brevipalpus obovatus]|uniref:nose resistant to fluoxetine protein 6-like isoform X2 n=1 Tax=Brevipalpus obovatus TaxID=246614 RepID=UPI003D9F805C
MAKVSSISETISNVSQAEILSTPEPGYQQGDESEVLEDSETSATDSSIARKDSGESSPNGNATFADDQSSEGEALGTLLAFLKDTVGNMLKTTMPTIVQGGMESNVSSECANSFLLLMQGLQEGKDWAFKILDSSGKPPSGILEGTLTDFGSFEQCLGVKIGASSSNTAIKKFEGKYCIMDIKAALEKNIDLSKRPKNIPEDSVVWNDVLREFWSKNNLLSFRYGLCIPSACNRDEISEIANYLAEPTGMEVGVDYCQMHETFKIDRTQLTIISILSVIIILVIAGTSLELYLSYKSEKKLMIGDERSWTNFFIAFSLQKNTKKLLDSAKKPLGSPLRHLDGIRFISVCWIICGHTYFYTDFVHYHHYRRLKHIQEIDDDLAFMPIANFTLSVNTFFFISGLLVVYANWKKLSVSDGKISFTEFFIHKVWRLWPPYLAIIGLVLVMPLFGSGPLWPQAVENTADLCRQNWWTNILFVNNFLPPDKLCLLHTWFLAAHMQFHLFSSLILCLLYRFPKLTLTLLSIGTVLSGGGVYVYTLVNDLRWPTVIADAVFIDGSQKILTLYIMPYNHLGSYLTGIIIGYLLVKYKKSKISKQTQVLAWLASLSTMIAVLFAPYSAFKGHQPSLTEAALYLSIHRTAWAIALGWLVFACSTDRGGPINRLLSWSAFGPLSNLSYLAYLVHPLLMLYHTGRTRERVYFGHYELFNTFLARTVMAVGLSYILYVTIELPFASLEKYINFLHKPRSQPGANREYNPSTGQMISVMSKNMNNLNGSKRTTDHV